MPGQPSDKPISRSSLPLPRDVRVIHANGSASVAELREFLGGLHGKSPQEVIGIVSNSLLVQSMILATLATAAILAIFTVGPYLAYGPPKPKEAGKKPEVAAAESALEASAPAVAAAAAPASNEPDPVKAAKAMGLDETKGSDPKKNPLDDPKLDNLLDKLE